MQPSNSRTYSEEIAAALRSDDLRLGEVFRAREEDGNKSAADMAKDFGLGTEGVIYTNLRAIDTLEEGRVRPNIKSTSAAQMASMIRGFCKRHATELSEATVERLTDLAVEHERIAGDEEAITQENEEIEREVESDLAKGVPGIYVYTYAHYMRYPILERAGAEPSGRTYLKIGMSDTDMNDRIQGQNRTNVPEPPLVLRMYTVPEGNIKEVESKLHDHIKSAGHGRMPTKGTGKEWFLTQLQFIDSTSELLGLELYRAHESY